jgi:glycosyltransferase involved in cell wall biosynthesis
MESEHSSHQYPTVLAIGNLIPRKGFDDLLRTAHYWGMLRYFWQIIIIGDGPERKRLQAMANESDCYRLEMHHWVPNLEPFWQRADVLAMPSKYDKFGLGEGLGLVGIEAIKRGIPVAAYDHGGIGDFVWDGQTGYLTREGNWVGLGLAIHNCMNEIPHVVAPRSWYKAFSVKSNMDLVKEEILNAYKTA